MHPWFIFTSTGGLFTTTGDSVNQAVAEFKRCKHPRAGEIVGVIRGAATMEIHGRTTATPVFGVVCCVAEPQTTTQAPGAQGIGFKASAAHRGGVNHPRGQIAPSRQS
jgi:hypothetical protein